MKAARDEDERCTAPTVAGRRCRNRVRSDGLCDYHDGSIAERQRRLWEGSSERQAARARTPEGMLDRLLSYAHDERRCQERLAEVGPEVDRLLIELAEAGVRAAKVIADLWADEMGPPAN